MTTCTECGGLIRPKELYVAGFILDGRMAFVESSDKNPKPWARVRLGSVPCMNRYLKNNREHFLSVCYVYLTGRKV